MAAAERPRRRGARRVALALAALVAIAVLALAAPVVWVETACVSPREAGAGEAPPARIDAAHRRVEVDSYLSYPEWSIVHAYEDLAAVARMRDESAFGYAASVRGYWRGLCSTMRLASARGEVSGDMRAMLHVIGTSFSVEMAVKGAWESTVGALALAAGGASPTPEDAFARQVAADYAAFLRQTPWYAYPFADTLARFWAEVPIGGPVSVRRIERRVALTLEWGVKAVYARLLGAAAGLSPAATRLRSVMSGPAVGIDPRIALVEPLGSGLAVVETPRYRAFTEIVAGLAARGGDVVEIAGNDDVLITVVAPVGSPPVPGVATLFAVPVQSRPGHERRALDLRVERLCETIRAMRDGQSLEHVYDY